MSCSTKKVTAWAAPSNAQERIDLLDRLVSLFGKEGILSLTADREFIGRKWSIESFFQSLKKRGFRLEDTHLRKLDRLKKLMAVVSLAFVFCWPVGCYYHDHRAVIVRKNHGYKAKSFFRKGLDLLRRACKFIERRTELLAHYLSWLGKDPSITFV